MKSRAQLNTAIDTTLPSADPTNLTAAAVRAQLKDIVANVTVPQDDGASLSSQLLGQVNGIATLDSGGKVPTSQLPTSSVNLDQIGIGFDGEGAVLQAGSFFAIPMNGAGTITGWQLWGDPSGSLVVDIRKGTPSGGAVTFTSITPSAPPTLSSQSVATSGVLTIAYANGDIVLGIITGTPVSVTKAALAIKLNRS